MTRSKLDGAWRLALALTLAVLAACSPTAVAPTVVLTSPAADAQLAVGQSVPIVGKVTGSNLKQVDVVVDGVKYASVDKPTAPNEFAINIPWTPDLVGAHVVQVKAINTSSESVASASVFVTAKAPAAAVAPTAAPAAAAAAAAAPTAAPTAAPQPTAKPTDVPNQVTVTNDFARVRGGPAVSFPELGQLTQNSTAKVTGKNAAEATWWRIDYQGKDGWVFGELVSFKGDATKIDVIKVALPTAPPPAAQAPAPSGGLAALPTAPVAGPTVAPTPALPPSAYLPYSQNMRFSPRDDIGDVPLGYNEPKNSTLVWEINGAVKAELQVTSSPGPGIFDACPAGDTSKVTIPDAVNKRMNVPLPTGQIPFSISAPGYYLFTMFVTKTDGSTTAIPRNVIVDCYKRG